MLGVEDFRIDRVGMWVTNYATLSHDAGSDSRVRDKHGHMFEKADGFLACCSCGVESAIVGDDASDR